MHIILINRQKKFPVNEKEVLRKTKYILTRLREKDVTLSILFTNNRTIRKLNTQYRNRRYATDVLSFSMREGHARLLKSHLLGDIVISVEKAYANSKLHKFSLRDELLFLILHGVLHLKGYDHETKSELRRLERIQNKLFNEVI